MQQYQFSVKNPFEQVVSRTHVQPWSSVADVGDVQPGTKRTVEQYRKPEFLADLLQPLGWSCIPAGITGMIRFLLTTMDGANGDAKSAGLWALCTLGIVWIGREVPKFLPSVMDACLLVARVIVEGPPVEQKAGPALTLPPAPLPVEIIERQGEGRRPKMTLARLARPASDPDGLWRYCDALSKDEAFLSWGGGKGAPGGKFFGYSEDEYEVWRKEASRAGLIMKKPGRNQGYDPTERGKHAFARVAERGLEDVQLSVQERPSVVRPSGRYRVNARDNGHGSRGGECP